MKKILLWLTAILLFAAGFGLLVFPSVRSWMDEYRSSEVIDGFRQDTGQSGAEAPKAGPESGELESISAESQDAEQGSADYGTLLREMREYNAKIYQEHQASLVDAWSFEEDVFDLQSLGIQNDIAGYITIDAMDLQLPLYIGATEENMQKGAVVLGQTSMPVGGENTNCVIAAHRGYRGVPFFREIEKLQPGDLVQVTNFQETLNYRVVKSIVINPDEIDAIKILAGQDMVTLVSCHPYTENYLRYLVYCVRDNTVSETENTGESPQTAGETEQQPLGLAAEDIPYEGIPYTSSEKAIREEQLLNRAGLFLFAGLLILAVIAVFAQRCGKRKRKKQ